MRLPFKTQNITVDGRKNVALTLRTLSKSSCEKDSWRLLKTGNASHRFLSP